LCLLVAAYDVADLPARWQAQIQINMRSGCWIWTGRLDKDGYARIGSRGGHRVIYEMLAGPIPDGLVCDHVAAWGCTSRACVNPAHIEPVTSVVNVLRGTSFSAVNKRKVKCDNGHPFDGRNTYIKPNGHRDCRCCIRARVAKYQRRRRSEQRELLRRAA
jgi:HNH endonuclease